MSQKNDTIVNTYCDAPAIGKEPACGDKIVVGGKRHKKLDADFYIGSFNDKGELVKKLVAKTGDYHKGCLAALLYDASLRDIEEASGGGKA